MVGKLKAGKVREPEERAAKRGGASPPTSLPNLRHPVRLRWQKSRQVQPHQVADTRVRNVRGACLLVRLRCMVRSGAGPLHAKATLATRKCVVQCRHSCVTELRSRDAALRRSWVAEEHAGPRRSGPGSGLVDGTKKPLLAVTSRLVPQGALARSITPRCDSRCSFCSLHGVVNDGRL
ncbi:hypothetical protein ACK3TF_000723 [Chlorella vulgaris]